VLIGGVPAVLENGARAINRASQRIEIVATCQGYAAPEEHLNFLREHSDVDIVLVAMGSPRSEELIAPARDVCAPKLFWNIGGGTLHFYAGTLKRVPERISKLGLQWLWRIVHEPAIAPRYLIGIPNFLASVIRCRIQQSTQQRRTYGSAYR
jgi:exopolysaccharide biosynthesis WecB/TagA/CpsF family protein